MPPEIVEEEDAFAQAMALLQQEANQEGQEHPQVQSAGQSNVTEYEEIQSPTLRDLDASRRPSRKTVCETCPNSVWFASPEEVKCYCRVMFMTSWSTKQQNVLINCDGIYLGQEE
ncbi:conjugal transfer protein TraH [Salmonella enterica subsp. houtenae serovar 51:z4,z23:-]|nr:conjugal transfer protein TraH [Salmonella enterica subsp. houtenae serovar 51:z4,z23:-]